MVAKPVRCDKRGESPLFVCDVERQVYRTEIVNGKKVNVWTDPVYRLWNNMYSRVYKRGDDFRPGYAEVEICEEWRRFSNFDRWCDENYVEGAVLDKDLLVPGSKEYSPNTCCFVPAYVNTCLSTSSRSKRNNLFGVHIRKRDGKITASINKNNRKVHLGYFSSEEEAHFAWLEAKAKSIREVADRYRQECSYWSQAVYNSLIQRANYFSGFAERKEIYEEKHNVCY